MTDPACTQSNSSSPVDLGILQIPALHLQLYRTSTAESSYRYLIPPPRTPKNLPCAATRILAQYSSRTRACVGSLSIQRQISIPVLVLRTVPVQSTHVSAYRYRSVSCTRTAVGFTGDLQIQSRASLFSARSESNPVLILLVPLRNRIKTYLVL